MTVRGRQWRRRTLILTYMEKRGFYHLFSDGFRTDALFEDKAAFVAAMNIIAVCFLKCKVVIPAFCLMDNHVHFVLYGTLKECCEFRDRFAHKYSLWYYNRYSCRRSEPIDFGIKLMEDEKYILNSIAYVLRNGIAAGYIYCAEDYPWSSAGLYFRRPETLAALTAEWTEVSLLTIRKRREMFQTMNDIPGDWKVTPEGFLWPGNYVDYQVVEKLFRTPKSFAFFMGQSKEDEISMSLGAREHVALPDMELREKAVAHSRRMFRTSNLRELDADRRMRLAKTLRKEYRCSYKQIARIIHLDQKYLKELLG